MDCCNYMPYRQPYYGGGTSGGPYYEHFPYPGDFYGHPYHEYGYGTPPYYAQHWPCAATIPDYVYNPKEARIRKAMREASRERALGATSMPPPSRNSGRRQTNWMPNHEDQLMMTPQQVLRGSIDPPMCSTGTGYASETVPPFMPINGYAKEAHVLSSPGPIHPPNSYLQVMQNPMVQLQHETNVWHGYGERIPTRSSDDYLLPEIHVYQQPRPMARHTNGDAMENERADGEVRREEENLRATEEDGDHKFMMNEHHMFESKGSEDVGMIGNGGMQREFMPVYSEDMMQTMGKSEGVVVVNGNKTKKPAVSHPKQKSSSKPLPDFNEAFGGTERGRFQSPPDPRLVQHDKGYMDFFFNNSPVKYEDYHI